MGYFPHAVELGEAAISLLGTRAFDLVKLDMLMVPGLSGRETYEQIAKKNPWQKAITVSGYSESSGVEAALSMGVGACGEKPYTLEQLSVAVYQELKR